jgi:hypothetical protein
VLSEKINFIICGFVWYESRLFLLPLKKFYRRKNHGSGKELVDKEGAVFILVSKVVKLLSWCLKSPKNETDRSLKVIEA